MSSRRSLPLPVVWILRLIVGGVFVYASLDKIQNPQAFAQAISNYRILPYNLLHPIALFLPWLEMICGGALIIGFRQRAAAWLLALMTLIFIFGITSALSRGLDISCGCFHTEGGHGVGIDLLWRDALLMAGALSLTASPGRHRH